MDNRGGYGENKGMTRRCLSCRYDFSPEIVVGSLTQKHPKTQHLKTRENTLNTHIKYGE